MAYIFTANIIHRELNNWTNGCDPDSTITQFFGGRNLSEFLPIEITGDTLQQLLLEIQNRFKVSKEALLLNSCEELGRLDVQFYTDDVYNLSCQYKEHEQAYRDNEIDLYLCNLSGTVTRKIEDLDLEAIIKEEQK